MDRDTLRQRLQDRDLQRWSAVDRNDATRAVLATVPRTHEAMQLVDAVRGLLGERAWLDPWARDGVTRIAVRDGEWLVPPHLVVLALDVQRPPPPDMGPLPPELQARVDAAERMIAEARARQPQVLAVGPNQRSARLVLQEGDARFTIEYGDNGVKFESVIDGTGDRFASHDGPFMTDPNARLNQKRPLSLFAGDLQREGHALADLAERIVAMDVGARTPLRARVPVPVPGGLADVRSRGLRALRQLSWEDGVPEDARWAVIDGFSCTHVAFGPSRQEAYETWRTRIQDDPPQAPTPKVAPPMPPPRPATADATVEGDRATLSMEATFVFRPEIEMVWPPNTPENISCLAVPLPPLPPTPAAWANAGYRRLRLFGDHGQSGLALVRQDPGRWTVVGGVLADAYGPQAVDDALNAQEQRNRAQHSDPFGYGDPWLAPRYPYKRHGVTPFDDAVGRWDVGWRGTGYGWGDALNTRWDLGILLAAQRIELVSV